MTIAEVALEGPTADDYARTSVATALPPRLG